MVSYQQALSTAGSSRKSWQGEKKGQIIKLSNGLMRQAVGPASRGRRLHCRRIRKMGKGKARSVKGLGLRRSRLGSHSLASQL